MSVYVSYTVGCDQCGSWVTEAPSAGESRRDANRAGFRRRGGEYLCPTCRPDVCGVSWRQEIGGWCLLPPDHEGRHDWERS